MRERFLVLAAVSAAKTCSHGRCAVWETGLLIMRAYTDVATTFIASRHSTINSVKDRGSNGALRSQLFAWLAVKLRLLLIWRLIFGL